MKWCLAGFHKTWFLCLVKTFFKDDEIGFLLRFSKVYCIRRLWNIDQWLCNSCWNFMIAFGFCWFQKTWFLAQNPTTECVVLVYKSRFYVLRSLNRGFTLLYAILVLNTWDHYGTFNHKACHFMLEIRILIAYDLNGCFLHVKRAFVYQQWSPIFHM